MKKRFRTQCICSGGSKLSSRGMTLIETSVGVSILTIILAIFGDFLIAVEKTNHKMLGYGQTQEACFNTIDQIRYRLLEGEFETITISEDGSQLSFNNPYLPGTTSSFRFNGDKLEFAHDASNESNFRKIVGSIDFLGFSTSVNQAIVTVTVRDTAIISNNRPRPIELSSDIFPRN